MRVVILLLSSVIISPALKFPVCSSPDSSRVQVLPVRLRVHKQEASECQTKWALLSSHSRYSTSNLIKLFHWHWHRRQVGKMHKKGDAWTKDFPFFQICFNTRFFMFGLCLETLIGFFCFLNFTLSLLFCIFTVCISHTWNFHHQTFLKAGLFYRNRFVKRGEPRLLFHSCQKEPGGLLERLVTTNGAFLCKMPAMEKFVWLAWCFFFQTKENSLQASLKMFGHETDSYSFCPL